MQEHLKSIINYDPETGVFLWKTFRGGKAYAGTVAGHKTTNGYIYINFMGRQVGAHRLAWLYVYGEMPSKDVDHINRIKTDNRITNLRLSSRSQNMRNCIRKRTDKSPYQGVCWDISCDKWLACITVDYKQIHLGRFDTAEQARDVYLNAAREYHGEFSPFA